jgi:hypothetical protein
VDEILALDPTLRRLSFAERFRRSRRLIELTWRRLIGARR